MAIRHIIAVALMASACAAQAGVVSASTASASAQTGFLSHWTTSDGSSVLGSGIMSSNLSLIGGVSYGAGTSASDALMSKASSSLGSAGQTKLFYTKGIDGMYLLGSGHGVLAAMLGNGVSVVGSNGGVVVGQGVLTAASVGTGTMSSTNSDAGQGTVNRAAAELPEPSTLALLMAGVFGVGMLGRRRPR